MNKIESARIVRDNKGTCEEVSCNECFNIKNCDQYNKEYRNYDFILDARVSDAESYIKRHEQKSKKKDHIRDTTKKVDSYAKKLKKDYVQDLKPVTLVEDKVEEPTPLEIAKMIRDNGYRCVCLPKSYNCYDRMCPLYYRICGREDEPFRKKLIDDYISANESKPVKTVGIDNSDVTLARPTVKENLSVPCEHLINGDSCGNAFEPCEEDCPANPEYHDPIRVDIPDIFYCPTPQGILRFKRSQILLKDTNNDDCLLKYHEEYPCYRTIEEAVMVAKKLWGDKLIVTVSLW